MNSRSVTSGSPKSQESLSSFAQAFATHLAMRWELSPQHQKILETACELFQLGLVAVPLHHAPLQSLCTLLGKEFDLSAETSLTWPSTWFLPAKDGSLSFVIHLIDEIPYLYPQKLFQLESQIVESASFLFEHSKRALLQSSPERSLPHELLLGLKKAQHDALVRSQSHLFTIITGGPGTGKSFTAARIIEAHRHLQKEKGSFCHVIVAAPTGKAVTQLQKRLSRPEEKDPDIEFTTLHRLLKISPREGSLFKKPFFDASLLLIDECSMIDLEVFALLLSKLHPKTQVVLIGDPDQLPPVGAGDVFSSLCRYAKATDFSGFTALEESVRFENEILGVVAHLCQKQDPALLHHLQKNQSITPLSESMGLQRLRVLDLLYWNWRNQTTLFKADSAEEALEALKSSICLCSMREGPWGVEIINRYFLEKALASKCRFLPILFTRNHEHLGFQNGSLGVIEIAQEGHFSPRKLKAIPRGTIHYHSSDGIRTLESREIHSFELSFATSVHKSQGSEFHHVCCVLSPGSEQFGKALLYTAATRAKKTLHFFSLEETLIKTLCFPSGNLSHLHDRLRLKTQVQKEVDADEKVPSLSSDSLALQ